MEGVKIKVMVNYAYFTFHGKQLLQRVGDPEPLHPPRLLNVAQTARAPPSAKCNVAMATELLGVCGE